MGKYIVITDAAADIPYELFEKGFGVTVIPIKIKMKSDEFLQYPDFRNMSAKEFYPLVKMGALPSTVPISKEDYIEVFEEKLKGDNDIIYIGISGGLSDSVQAATAAAEDLKERYPSSNISIIDSKNASTGLGLLVTEAIRLKESNTSYEEAVNILQKKRDRIRNYFFVDDIFHLKRGGMISKSEPSAAAALKIRTVFKVDTDGKLAITTKVRGNPNALEHLAKKVCEEAAIDSYINIAAANGGDRIEKRRDLLMDGLVSDKDVIDQGLAQVISVSERINQRMGTLDIRIDKNASISDSVEQRIMVSEMSLVGGTHSGPGTVAVAFFAKE